MNKLIQQKLRTGKMVKTWPLLIIFLIFGAISCSSYENFKQVTEDVDIPSQVYKFDYNKVWQEVLKVTAQYERESYNQEAGIIKTRWKDNTLEMNFADSFGSNDAVKAAQFRLIINVVKGFRGTKEVTRVSIFKRQRVEQDFLQGWKIVRSDGILEKTLLYRIDRALQIEKKLQQIEDKKVKEAEKNF
jgi:hypothetical protein